MKAHSPLLGFNNNVQHRGRLFHIQTEDSGVKHPHVITHLFADGGRILKTTKTSYAEHVGSDRLSDVVRDLMKEQHKTMFIALRDGEFDHLFPEDAGPPASLPSLTHLAARVGQPAAPGTPATPPAAPVDAAPVAARVRKAAPDPFATAPPGLALDLTGLEDSGGGAPKPDAPAQDKPAREKAPSGRYVASRPAAVFATTSPEAGGSIFGDDFISEKSLDEVILSYLSDDLESPNPKK